LVIDYEKVVDPNTCTIADRVLERIVYLMENRDSYSSTGSSTDVATVEKNVRRVLSLPGNYISPRDKWIGWWSPKCLTRRAFVAAGFQDLFGFVGANKPAIPEKSAAITLLYVAHCMSTLGSRPLKSAHQMFPLLSPDRLKPDVFDNLPQCRRI
jgi:hypothetical protein